MIINDWLRGYGEIIRSHRQAVRLAQKEIIISGSYFLPSRRLLKLLKAASKRGVQVKIILTQESDVLLATRATRYLYRKMFKYGLQIFEWKHSVLHAKATIIDSKWVTIGSFNLNFLSAFESVELNLEIVDSAFATSFRSALTGIMEDDCAKISPFDFEKKYTFIHRITDWVAYQTLRYTMRFPLLFAKRLTKPFDAYGTRTYHTN
jgi:cardiolipin synthase